MKDSVGGISLEDIMAAASIDEPAQGSKQATDAEQMPAAPAKTGTASASSGNTIGGVSMEEIMAMAAIDNTTPVSKPEAAKPEPKVQEPVVKQVMPEVKVQEPAVRQVMPEVKVQEPAVKQVMPEVKVQEPAVKQVMPEVKVQEPAVKQVIPEVKVQEPAVKQVMPEVKVQEPVVKQVIPEVKKQVAAPVVLNSSEPVAKTTDVSDSLAEQTEKRTGIRSIYLFDIFAMAAEKKNVGLLIWIGINFLISSFLFLFGGIGGIIFGMFFFIISLFITVSPVGEWIIRVQSHCRKITDVDIQNRIYPLFNNVKEKARAKSYWIKDDVKLFICNDDSINAYAIGRKTVCITYGLLTLPDNQIEAILAHEFGHLAHGDTGETLIMLIGNLPINFYLMLFYYLFRFFEVIISLFGIEEFPFSRFFTFLLEKWTKLGFLICGKGNRAEEIQADLYSAELGYAKDLKDSFVEMDEGPAPKGMFKTLMSSHPETADRVIRLNEYLLSAK